ncbi:MULTISPECIES: DUF262 domain-containing protein [Rahnella]|jgi:hypothetical protein|uniref:DUF262 domain-containing protein n=1 Tax=Rahnella sp. GSA61A TaxID=2862678 RepID=UPI001CBA81E5|nr:DUF262 domain-containing protein [Rahnella sp. GSA61A]
MELTLGVVKQEEIDLPDDNIFNEDLGLQEDVDDNTWSEEQRAEVGNAVVFSTDWTTETITNQIRKGNIELNPNFQRRDAWTAKEKSRFIESLVLGFPIPPIVLAVNANEKGKYIVLDGKQRLLSIYKFTNITPDGEKPSPPLKLTGLKIKEKLNGMTFKSMMDSPEFLGDISQLENQPIRTIVIKNYPHESFLYEVFLRLNTGSKPLSPQELRQALHPGSFTLHIDRIASESIALQEILNRTTPDFRMRDVEILLREISYYFFLNDYDGDLKKFLDNVCKIFNKNWGEVEKRISEYCEEFEKSHAFVKEIFGKNAYRKFLNGEFINRFNRGILDSMSFYFTSPAARKSLEDKKETILTAFKDLCCTDKKYMDSIESTTKTIPATRYRIVRWGEILRDLGGDVVIPVFKD